MKAILQMVFVFLVASIGVIVASTTTVDETTYHASSHSERESN